jgi:Flp pilus assembly protein CpaB
MGDTPRDMLSTRGGSLALAIGAAIVAGILIFVFVQRYRDHVNSNNAATSVFVARSLIPKGSSADVIASEQLLQRTGIKGSQALSGAITDTSVLHGQVTTTAIYPGQQIVAADFSHQGDNVAGKLSGTARAIAVPVDNAHGLIGFVHAGDYVDVLAGLNGSNGSSSGSTQTLIQGVLVLSAPSSSGGGVGGNSADNVVLRVSDQEAPKIAFAADNGKIWIALRPPAGATQSAPASASQGSLGGH